MKKKLLLLCLTISMCLCGCSNPLGKEPYSADTMQAELEAVEAKSTEVNDKDSGSMSQAEMNDWAKESFKVWDDELSSILKRLNKELDADAKVKLSDEQDAWTSQKEANTFAAGLSWTGGSAQPCITYGSDEAMTRARVYELAAYLADLRGETFETPAEVQKSIAEDNPTLDEVFEKMRGQWIFDDSRGAVIGIEPSSEQSDFAPAGSKWVVWETGGDVISDLDVYGYSYSDIIFKSTSSYDGSDCYYWLTFDGDTIFLFYSKSLDDIYLQDPTIGH